MVEVGKGGSDVDVLILVSVFAGEPPRI